ncbi:hypothetical protein DPMN_077576 [Dreissena polymorpha]|uniref:Uncharacterized protein n=1 Tax=Dreissena polymorpha TaxID=45954 RepID=A0A9D3YL58_DREPO|nr:hypothetical protein DPMN_077576 [Dreissena polymorpha]
MFCPNFSLSEFIRIDPSEKKITVEDNTILSPGPSRFANAGRPAWTGMIPGQQPDRVPVNPDWLRSIPCPDESRRRPGIAPPARPGRAPIYRNTAGTHCVYTGIRPRKSYGNAPVSPRSSPLMPRRRPGECRDQKINRDHLPVMINVPMKFHDPRRKHS